MLSSTVAGLGRLRPWQEAPGAAWRTAGGSGSRGPSPTKKTTTTFNETRQIQVETQAASQQTQEESSLNELMDLVFRAGLDSKFQGLQRGPGVPEPGGVGRRTEWCTVAGIRLGQFHSVPAFLWVRRTAVTY